MTGRCGTCRHWRLPRANAPEDGGYCRLMASASQEPSRAIALPAGDDPNAAVVVLTYPDFGCSQWERR